MTTATRHRWTDRAKGIAWKVPSATRDTWHMVVLHADGHLECSCEWGQQGDTGRKACRHMSAVLRGDSELPRPFALWTDEAGHPTAREWADLIERMRSGRRAGDAARCQDCGRAVRAGFGRCFDCLYISDCPRPAHCPACRFGRCEPYMSRCPHCRLPREAIEPAEVA